MTGHGEKLSRKQEVAIVALLEESTVAAAARRVGVGEATLCRWQQAADFQRAFADARRQLLDRSLTNLRHAGQEAVETLRRNMECGNPSVEVKAASELISWMFKAAEMQEIEDRLNSLEASLGVIDVV